MKENFVKKAVKKNSIYRILAAMVIISIFLAVCVVFKESLITALIKPMSITYDTDMDDYLRDEELAIFGKLEDEELVFIDTGIYYEESSDSSKIYEIYVGLVNDKFVVASAKVNKDEIPAEIEGEVLVSPYKKNDISSDFTDFYGTKSETAQMLTEMLGYTVTTSDFTDGLLMLNVESQALKYKVCWAVVVLLLLISIIIIIKMVMNVKNFKKSGLYKKLGAYGDADQVMDEINTELDVPHITIRNIEITDRWLVEIAALTTEVIRLDDILWIYGYVVKEKYGKSYSVRVHVKDGSEIILGVNSEDTSNQVLNALYQSVPGIFVGYNDDLKDMWNRDKGLFEKEVIRRKGSDGDQGIDFMSNDANA